MNYLSVKLKSNDDGKEAKSIGDCGEDRSSRTHSIPDRVGNNQLHERADVRRKMEDVIERRGSEMNRMPLLGGFICYKAAKPRKMRWGS